jgi:hypothetical protein
MTFFFTVIKIFNYNYEKYDFILLGITIIYYGFFTMVYTFNVNDIILYKNFFFNNISY